MVDRRQPEPWDEDEEAPLPDLSQLSTIHDRKKILEISSAAINVIYKRLSAPRLREQASDDLRVRLLKTLRDLLQVHSAILKEMEISDLEARIVALEQGGSR